PLGWHASDGPLSENRDRQRSVSSEGAPPRPGAGNEPSPAPRLTAMQPSGLREIKSHARHERHFSGCTSYDPLGADSYGSRRRPEGAYEGSEWNNDDSQ